MKKQWLVFSGLIVIGIMIVWLAFEARAPVWMVEADGFVLAGVRFFNQGLGLGSWNRYWT